MPQPQLEPGQTLLFLGDHTSPDDRGYVGIADGVIARFHPDMRLNLLSAGSKGQSASGLRSRNLLDVIASSRPDWLVIGIGLGDAMREPVARKLLNDYRQRLVAQDEAVEATFGPEYRPPNERGPVPDNGPEPTLELERLAQFQDDLREAITALGQAGVRSALLTTIVVGNDLRNPVNMVLKAYNKSIREVASEQGAPLVDIERAFRDIFDRAANYKQKVALTGPNGDLNAQGQTLLARILLQAFDLLPQPGFRPRR